MNDIHDLVFTAVKSGNRQRVDGKLFIKATGSSYDAVSGSSTLLPLPNGGYIVSGLRFRDKTTMARTVPPKENNGGGMSFPAWSMELEPLFSTQRTLLRIHPDGNLPGTEGCIGIIGEVHKCFADLETAINGKTKLLLLVNHNNPMI